MISILSGPWKNWNLINSFFRTSYLAVKKGAQWRDEETTETRDFGRTYLCVLTPDLLLAMIVYIYNWLILSIQ